MPLVLKGGLEPPCPLRHMNLNHACLPFHHFSLGSKSNGGVDRVRTDDPHNAIVMLFQLSYNPIGTFMRSKNRNTCQYFLKIFVSSAWKLQIARKKVCQMLKFVISFLLSLSGEIGKHARLRIWCREV